MGDDSNQALFDAEMNHMLEEGSEVFILSIEVFKTAISAIFSPDPEVAQYALLLTGECAAKGDELRRQTVGVLARWAPKGDALYRVVNVERTAAESLVISQHGQHIAEHALALRGAADQYFTLVHQQAAEVFFTLVQQIYFGLRGCLALTSTHDQSLATRVIAEDAHIHHLQLTLTDRIEQLSFALPQHAGELRHLVEIVQACRQIGLSVLTICRDSLAAPRYMRTPSFRS